MGAFKLVDKGNGISELIFDLPGEKVNKLSSQVLLELDGILKQLETRNDLQLLVLTSLKPGIFIAGADIREIAGISDPADARVKAEAGQHILNRLAALPYPTLAVIDGACLGGGMELALACTYRVCGDNAKVSLGLPEVSLGIIPGFGGTQRLPRLVGLASALELILSGRPVNAKKALKVGLVDGLFASEFLEEKVTAFIGRILTPKGAAEVGKRRASINKPMRLLEKVGAGRDFMIKKAKTDLLKKTRGQYPAPLAALEVIDRTGSVSLTEGLRIEAQAFSQLASTRICKNLIRVFFTSEELKKDAGAETEGKPAEVKHGAILGAGVMGGGIAWLFSSKDLPVRMKDITWEAVGKGYASARAMYKPLEKSKKLTPAGVSIRMQRISGTLDYSGFAPADVVVEAVVEDMGVKKKVLAEVESHMKESAILASNTSSLSITEMGSALKHPGRFAGLHFFNPVNRMPLVEVIPGEQTDPDTVATLVALSRKMGKTPIVVKDCRGFLVNRILIPYMNEAALILQEAGGMERIDKLVYDYGMPMGPFTLADEVGIDVGFKVAKILEEAYGDRMKVAPLLAFVYLDQKLLGKKAGKGFFLHGGGKKGDKGSDKGSDKRPNPDIAPMVDYFRRSRNVEAVDLSDVDILDRCLLSLVNEAARCLEEGVVKNAAYLDMAMIMGTGFPPFRGGPCRYADELGIGRVVNRLESLAERFGERFRPAALLYDMRDRGRNFYAEEGSTVSEERVQAVG